MDAFEPANGPRLSVDDTGGNGLPVIFQHGLCGNAAQPAEVFPADAAFRRITIECRGHGTSEVGPATAFSIQRFADDIADYIRAKALAPVIVGGISMGAAIALRLAAKCPDLVRGLIVARPAWTTEPFPANNKPNWDVGNLLSQFPPDEALARFNASETAKILETEGPDNLVSLRGFFKREPIAVTSAMLMAIASGGPGVTCEEILSIQVPTLVIGHQLDHVHPLAMAIETAKLVPRARFVEITPKAVDKTRYVTEFTAALQTFLKDFT